MVILKKAFTCVKYGFEEMPWFLKDMIEMTNTPNNLHWQVLINLNYYNIKKRKRKNRGKKLLLTIDRIVLF